MQHSVLVLNEVVRRLEILVNHLLHERVEVDLALPPEQSLRLRGVTVQQAAGVKHRQRSRKNSNKRGNRDGRTRLRQDGSTSRPP